MVYLTISTSIGGGVIVDGNILEGASGTEAELGHMTIDWHGERCNCGNIGSAAEALGVGLINIIHIINPDLIILGGGVTQMGDILIEPALRIVQDRAMVVPRDSVRIVPAELGANTGLVGAGALIYHYSHN